MTTLTIEDELLILNKYRITPNELMFIRTLLILQEDANEELFKTYIEILHNSNIQIRELITRLQAKGIILKSFKVPNPGEAFDPYSIPINKPFLKNLFKSSFEIGKELFEAYPQFGNINGCVVPLRTVAKKFDSLEDCYARYGKEIKWNPEIHSTIIDLVKWAKDNNILNCSLASFIINNGWKDLQALKDGEGNINYDAIKLV